MKKRTVIAMAILAATLLILSATAFEVPRVETWKARIENL